MAKYFKQEMSDLDGSGKKRTFYRMKIEQNLDMDHFIDHITHPGSGLSKGNVLQVLTSVADHLACCMAEGHSVTITGLGTFKPQIGVVKDKESDSFAETEGSHLNARSIEVNNISFRADKELIYETDRRCSLSRGGIFSIRKSPYSAQERNRRALLFLEEHSFLQVKDYMAINEMKRTSASLELQQLSQDPASGIMASGRGCHRVYVRREKG